jgi:hypothetical protein
LPEASDIHSELQWSRFGEKLLVLFFGALRLGADRLPGVSPAQADRAASWPFFLVLAGRQSGVAAVGHAGRGFVANTLFRRIGLPLIRCRHFFAPGRVGAIYPLPDRRR